MTTRATVSVISRPPMSHMEEYDFLDKNMVDQNEASSDTPRDGGVQRRRETGPREMYTPTMRVKTY